MIIFLVDWEIDWTNSCKGEKNKRLKALIYILVFINVRFWETSKNSLGYQMLNFLYLLLLFMGFITELTEIVKIVSWLMNLSSWKYL